MSRAPLETTLGILKRGMGHSVNLLSCVVSVKRQPDLTDDERQEAEALAQRIEATNRDLTDFSTNIRWRNEMS